MEIKHNPNYCTVIAKGGKHFLVTPKGEKIPAIVLTRVTDDVEGQPTALVKLLVNIKNTD